MFGNEINLVFAFQTINNNSRKRKNDGENVGVSEGTKSGGVYLNKARKLIFTLHATKYSNFISYVSKDNNDRHPLPII
jgi:hypothetical protein